MNQTSANNLLRLLIAISNTIHAFSYLDIYNATLLSKAIEPPDIIQNESVTHTKSSKTQDELPMWATENEKQKKYLRSSSNIFYDTPVQSSSHSIYVPAEYEPISAVLITNRENDSFRELKEELSIAITDAGVEVWMIGGDVQETPGLNQTELYKSITNIDVDSTWVRDYGPIIGLNTKSNKMEIIDTTYRWYYSRKNDDRLPCKLSPQLGESADCIHTSLLLDGGNALFDGDGNFFMTDRTYDWNFHSTKNEVDDAIKTYFGVHTIHSLPYAVAPVGNKFYLGEGIKEPADGTGHIDMFIKIVSPCVVLIAQEEENDIMYESLEIAVDYFTNLSCPSSPTGYYKIHRICGWYDTINAIWYSYTNSLIVNDVVIVPSYNNILDDKCNDARAVNVYKDAMPDKKIISINTDDSIRLGGSIHCLTRDIPKL